MSSFSSGIAALMAFCGLSIPAFSQSITLQQLLMHTVLFRVEVLKSSTDTKRVALAKK